MSFNKNSISALRGVNFCIHFLLISRNLTWAGCWLQLLLKVTEGQLLFYQLLLNIVYWHKFFYSAYLMAPRDMKFGMYTEITTRNDIRYMYIHYMIIKGHTRSNWGHKRSKIENKTQGPNLLHAYSKLHKKLHMICEFNPDDPQRSKRVAKGQKQVLKKY